MISISHWGMFQYVPGPEEVEWRIKSGMEPLSLPYFDAVFPGGKTGREIARENLKAWAERASA